MKKYIFLFTIVMAVALSSCSGPAQPDETVADNSCTGIIQLEIPETDTTYFELDTSSVFVVKDDEYTIYFVKKVEKYEGEIFPFPTYVAVCKNNATGKWSEQYDVFSASAIEPDEVEWAEPVGNLLTPPALEIGNYYPNGKKQLRIKNRVHNDTMYNAVVTAYYAIDPETMNLDYRFSVEEISFVNELPTAPRDYDLYIKRVLDRENVKVYLCRNPQETGEQIGSYSVVFNKDGKHKHINVKKDNKEMEDIFFTVSPGGDVLLFRSLSAKYKKGQIENQIKNIDEVIASVVK